MRILSQIGCHNCCTDLTSRTLIGSEHSPGEVADREARLAASVAGDLERVGELGGAEGAMHKRVSRG